jgi:hypothetical protein
VRWGVLCAVRHEVTEALGLRLHDAGRRRFITSTILMVSPKRVTRTAA